MVNRIQTCGPETFLCPQKCHGLVESKIVPHNNATVTGGGSGFNGYTATSSVYTANVFGESVQISDYTTKFDTYCASNEELATCLTANRSEDRTTWTIKYKHTGSDDVLTLTGQKVNETYTLLRSGYEANKNAGSATLAREEGIAGGWYLFKGIENE